MERRWILVVLVLHSFSIRLCFTATVCPSGSYSYENICYKYHKTEALTWAAARQRCQQSLGGDLLVIHSRSLYDQIIRNVQQSGASGVWLGASDTTVEGHFYWVDGSVCCDPYWTPGNPDNDDNEDCLGIWKTSSHIGYNDFLCTIHLPFFCTIKECPQIQHCQKRHCSNVNDVICDTCENNNVFYKPWNYKKSCERMCSYDTHTCWPGTCNDELTSGCTCDSGFRKVSNSTHTVCQLTSANKPTINTCQTRVDGSVAKQTQPGKCSELKDFYGNFQPTSVKFDMQADFIVSVSVQRPAAPRRYIQEENFGITDASIALQIMSVSGLSPTLETIALKTDRRSSQDATRTFSSKQNHSLGQPKFHLTNGERLCLVYEAFGGGFFEPYDFKSNTILNAVPYDKTKAQETVCYRYDNAKPQHCLVDISCNPPVSEPLQVASRITRDPIVPIKFSGWKDPVPIGGTNEHASGLESIEVTVHQVSGGIVDIKTATVNNTKLTASETSLILNLTAESPRLYCIQIEVKDVADNVQQARRFVLVDYTTIITSSSDKPITVTSASQSTNFVWQTHHNDICLRWTDHFSNEFYQQNNLLGKINPDPHSLITGIYEQVQGPLPVSGTLNVHGIVQFKFLWSRNGGVSSVGEIVPDFQNQTFCKRLYVADGDTYTLTIEAIDIVNNSYSENRTVYIDRTVPHIKEVGLMKNGIKRLFVHDDLDLSTMTLAFEAVDPHSGILNVEWTFGTSDAGKELGSGVIGVAKLYQSSCSPNISSCYCPHVGSCEWNNYSVPLNKLVSNNTHQGTHNRNYYFTIRATNNARLSNTEHLDILVDDSPPEAGVIFEGTEGLKDIDYTSEDNFMVHWHGFIDHESGIREYRLGHANYCLGKDHLYSNEHENISEYNVVPYTENAIRMKANFTGKVFVSIIAINNAMEASDVVCSDGITRDISVPALRDLKLEHGRWDESIFCKNGRAWLLQFDLKKTSLQPSLACEKMCKQDSSGFQLFDALPIVSAKNNNSDISEFLCTSLPLFYPETIIYVPNDHIFISWTTEERDSQIESDFVGFATASQNMSSLGSVEFVSTNRTTFFKKRHIGIGSGELFYVLIKIVSKAGPEQVTKIGPILIDETPPNVNEKPIVIVDKDFVTVGWNNDTFEDLEQSSPINQVFFQIVHDGATMTPLLEWRYEDVEKCQNFSGGCFKYPMQRLQQADSDLGLDFAVKLYIYNNAGHFTETITDKFRVPSKYPPGQAIVRDIDPFLIDGHNPKDVNIHFTSNTICVHWTGFKHHEQLIIEIGVGTSNVTADIVPFKQTIEQSKICINATSITNNVRYFALVRATCSGGTTLSSSNGVTIIDESELLNGMVIDIEPFEESLPRLITNTVNDNATKLCSVTPLHIGLPYTITILNDLGNSILDTSGDFYVESSTQNTYNVIPLVEKPCLRIKSNLSMNASVELARAFNNVLSVHNTELRVILNHRPSSLDINKLYFNIDLFSSMVSLNTSDFSLIASIQRVNDETAHVLRNVTLIPNTDIIVSLTPCNKERCVASVNSSVVHTEANIACGTIDESVLEIDGARSCVGVRLQWKKFKAKSNITIYQWTISRDAEANIILLPWKSVLETGTETLKVYECEDLPIHGHATLFICVRAYSSARNDATTCQQADTLVLTEIPTDTVYDVDMSAASWDLIRKMIPSSNIGSEYSILHDSELDFGTENSTVGGMMLYGSERNITWYLMSSPHLPYLDKCEEDTECGYSVTTDTGFAKMTKTLITPGMFYYICAYAKFTVVTREVSTEILQETRSCSNGFIIDNIPPFPGSVTVHNTGGYLNSLSNVFITWSGFDDNVFAETLGYMDRIKHYAFAIGSRPGGNDVADFSIVGNTNKVRYPLLNASDGSDLYVSIKATDQAGLTTVVSSEMLTVDTTPPDVGLVTIDTDYPPFISSQSFDIILRGFTDRHSGIDHFCVGIGTLEDEDDIMKETAHFSDLVHVSMPEILSEGHDYFLIVKAVNRAGLLSAPVSKHIILDSSPPTGGHVLDGNWSDKDIDVQTELRYIQSHWKGFIDPHSGIQYYSVGLGTRPFQDDVQDMIDVGLHTDITWNGAFLTGQRYYTTIEACNEAGLCRSLSSDGVMLDNSPPAQGVVRVGSSEKHQKYLPIGSSVHVQWIGFEDPQSGIEHYETCLGYGPLQCDVLPFSSSLLESSIIKTGLTLPSGTDIYATVKAVNKAGLVTTVSSDAFQIDDTPPVMVQRPFFQLQYNALKDRIAQWDNSVLRLSWKFVDNESKIASHIVTLKTHHEGHTPLEHLLTGDIENLTVHFDQSNWLNNGDEYYIIVTSCNAAGLCTSAQSDRLLIDSTPPHLGGFKPPLTWTNFQNFRNETKSKISLTWYGFIDAESSVDAYYVTISQTFSGNELSNGIITFPAENNKTEQTAQIDLDKAIKPDDLVIMSIWAKNAAGLNTSIARVSVYALIKEAGSISNLSGTFEIQKHSCDIHFCNRDCTCAIVGQPCLSDIKCTSRNDTRNSTDKLPIVYVYGGLPGNDYNITASSVCLSGHWITLGDETLVERYEWSIGMIGQPAGYGILDLNEQPWKDIGKRKQIVYCCSSAPGLIHDTPYQIYVRAWYSFDEYREFVSAPIIVDHSGPKQRKGRTVKDSDVSCKTDFDFIDWMDTITACWDGVFVESQGEIIHYKMSLGTTINGSDVYPQSNVGLNTSMTLTGLNLTHGTRYYFTITVYNSVGLHTSATSDGFVIDMDNPETGVVYNTLRHTDTAYQDSCFSFELSWHGFVDRFSGIISYHVAVVNSSITDYSNVTFTNVRLQTKYKFENVVLQHGRSYFGLVKAYDSAGHLSNIAISRVKTVDSTPPDAVNCSSFSTVVTVVEENSTFVSLGVDFKKDKLYIIKGLFIGQNVKKLRPALMLHRHKVFLPLSVNNNGTVEFEYSFISPWSGHYNINITAYDRTQMPFLQATYFRVDLRTCSSLKKTKDVSEAIMLRQLGTSKLQVMFMIQDEESGIKQVQLGAGTTMGGFQIKPLSNIHAGHGGNTAVIDVNVEHGTRVFVTVIAYNHAGLRSVFNASSVNIDRTPPEIKMVDVMLDVSVLDRNTTEQQMTTKLRWIADDDESGIKYCLCALGTSKGMDNINSFKPSDTMNTCTFKPATLLHGDIVYGTVKCINNIELASENSSDRVVVSVDKPDISKARVDVVASSGFLFGTRPEIQASKPYVLSDHSRMHIEWADFVDATGIDYYEYRLMMQNSTIVDWTSTGSHTSAVIKGINLAFGKLYSAEVRAVNNGHHASDPVISYLALYDREPGLSGKSISTSRQNDAINIDWSDVFQLVDGLVFTYDVRIGTRDGYTDIIELQRIDVTQYEVILPQYGTIITPDISELFISITCAYNTGLYTEYKTNIKM